MTAASGWVKIIEDANDEEHIVNMVDGKGTSLCGRYTVHGLYVPTASPHSRRPCQQCRSQNTADWEALARERMAAKAAAEKGEAE